MKKFIKILGTLFCLFLLIACGEKTANANGTDGYPMNNQAKSILEAMKNTNQETTKEKEEYIKYLTRDLTNEIKDLTFDEASLKLIEFVTLPEGTPVIDSKMLTLVAGQVGLHHKDTKKLFTGIKRTESNKGTVNESYMKEGKNTSWSEQRGKVLENGIPLGKNELGVRYSFDRLEDNYFRIRVITPLPQDSTKFYRTIYLFDKNTGKYIKKIEDIDKIN